MSETRLRTATRTLVAASLVAFGAATLSMWSDSYRSLEARAATAVIGLFGSTRRYGYEWQMFHHGSGVWFVVTTACTSSVLLIPLLLIGAWSTTVPLIRLRTALAGLCAGALVVLVLSTMRLAVIGLSWKAWGDPSLWVTHDLVGTLVSLAAMTAGVGTQLMVTGA